MLRRFLLVMACLGAPSADAAEVAPVGAAGEALTGGLVIGRHLAYYKDTTGKLGIEEIVARDRAGAFVAVAEDRPNFGYDLAPHWLRFVVDPGAAAASLVLEVGQPSLDTVEFHAPRPGGGYEVAVAGDQIPWDARPFLYRNHVFRIDLAGGAARTFYLKVASRNVLTVPLTLWPVQQFERHERDAQLLSGLFYGLICALFLYNLLVFLSLRDRAYLWYVGYVGTFGLALFTFDGFAFEYLWPHSVWWANHAMAAFLSAALLFGCLFAREFLGTHAQFPVLDRGMLAMVVIAAFLALCAATGRVLEYGAIMRALSCVGPVGAVLTLWLGIKTMLRGYRPARYFLLAWTALLVFVVVGALRNFALLPASPVATYGLHIGLGLDVILLSTALAARIRAVQAQVIGAQQQLIEAARGYQATLERRASELAEANRELESFSHTVAHDLRAPMRAIDGFASLLALEQGPSLSPAGREDIGAISRNARRMAQLVDGLLEFSRLGRVLPQETPIAMRALVDAVAQETRGGRKVDLSVGPLPDIRGDALLLRQVWSNLLENALKFSARNASPTVAIASERVGGQIVFSVADNGVGFDPAYADKLFGMFQRLHAATEFEGTGVGLATVRRIVERHGGRVWAEGRPGAGAVFRFSVPASRLVETQATAYFATAV